MVTTNAMQKLKLAALIKAWAEPTLTLFSVALAGSHPDQVEPVAQ